MPKSRFTSPIAKILELFLFSLIIGGINLFFQRNPGFFDGFINPYFVLALIVSAYYGKYYGFLSLIFSSCVMIFLLPVLFSMLHSATWNSTVIEYIKNLSPIPFALALAGVYLFGILRDVYVKKAERENYRLRQISREMGLLKRENRGLKMVNQTLEARVSRQSDSVTSLYSHVEEIYSLNLSKALDAILDITRRFTGATKASIWMYQTDRKELTLAAQTGWEVQEKATTVLSLDDSIEGWVLRNNMIFSVKLLLEYENLNKMDTGRNLITLPLKAGNRIWGILNISAMPFVKYNLYTERLLQMILALASPALDRAIEYDSIVRQVDIHPVTGLPSFSNFHSLLEKEIQRMTLENGSLSVIILELVNMEELQQSFGEPKTYELLKRVLDDLIKESHNQARFFQYKAVHQLAALYPGLDFDGTSQLCLEILNAINGAKWEIDEKPVNLEMILGYSTLGEKDVRADDMLEIAENLLEMQKV